MAGRADVHGSDLEQYVGDPANIPGNVSGPHGVGSESYYSEHVISGHEPESVFVAGPIHVDSDVKIPLDLNIIELPSLLPLSNEHYNYDDNIGHRSSEDQLIRFFMKQESNNPGGIAMMSRRLLSIISPMLTLESIIAAVMLSIVSFWFASTVFDWMYLGAAWIDQKSGSPPSNVTPPLGWASWCVKYVLGLVVFPIVIVVLYYQARRISERYLVKAYEVLNPGPVKAMVMFLSSDTVAREIREAGGAAKWLAVRFPDLAYQSTGPEPVESEAFRGTLHSWRMPIEAIRALRSLAVVAVIPSSNKTLGQKPGNSAPLEPSSEMYAEFADLVGVLTRGRVKVKSLADCMPGTQGVDYENPEQISVALGQVISSLVRDRNESSSPEHFSHAEIVVDITGGQKPASAVAAIFAAVRPERMFMYVSLDGKYTVRLFNLTYEG